MPDVVQDALSLFNNSSEANRQDSQALRLSMYLDDYCTEIDLLLRKQFHPDNYTRLYPMIANYYNTFKKIVNLKSVLYKQEAERQWYKKDGKTVDDTYNDIISKSNINTTMPLCNKLTNVNNTSFVRIIPDIDNETLMYAAVPSELINVTQDPNDPSKIVSLLHQVCLHDSYEKLNSIDCENRKSNNRYTAKYFYWTNEVYMVLDSDMQPIVDLDNPDNTNPYGIIPYVKYANLPSISGSIWNETVNEDLYSGTLQVNVLQTYLNNATKLQGYLQPYITGIDDTEAKKLTARVSDGLQPIVMSNENAKLGSVDLSGGTSEIRDTIHDMISEIADNHGVAFNSRTASAQKQSGVALAIEQEQINNIREEQTPLYRSAEKEMAKKSVIIANVELNANIDPDGSLAINFYEDGEVLSESDRVTRDEFDLKYNIKSVVDLYKERDPDVENNEDAIQRINDNKAINDELMNSFDFTPEADDETA